MITTDSSGFDEVLQIVQGTIESGFESQTLNSVAEEYCSEYSQELIERFNDRGNGEWPSLKPDTVKEKRRKNDSDPEKINYATGALEASLSDDGAGHTKSINADSVIVGTTIPYAGYVDQARPILVSPSGQLIQEIGDKLNGNLIAATK